MARRSSKPLSPGLRAAQTRVRNARTNYIEGVLNGTIPEPEKGTPEANSLASLASKARWGLAPKDMKPRSASSGIRNAASE